MPEDLAADYNVAPTKQIYAVVARRADQRPDHATAAGGQAGDAETALRELRVLRWGLVPSWAKDPSGGSRLINARAETVAVKPSFRTAFARRRCLIPADGFYEWRPVDVEGRSRKQPYYFHRTDGGVLAFAGIYELWRDAALPEDHPRAWLWTAAIVTTQATDDVGRIHDRMPMVVPPERWAQWLDPTLDDRDDARKAMVAAASAGLAVYPVAPAVNAVRNNGPELIAPLAAGSQGEDDAGAPGDGQRAGQRAAGVLL